jgi:hypothetical protein
MSRSSNPENLINLAVICGMTGECFYSSCDQPFICSLCRPKVHEYLQEMNREVLSSELVRDR